MASAHPSRPARELARHDRRYPNEDPRYREARFALLAEEIELRRHLERVAAQRRALPPGGAVTGDYRFIDEDGTERDFAALFGGHDDLIVYNMMFGPRRERPCPMCTTLLDVWDGVAPHLQERVGLAVVARAPIERLRDLKRERGWRRVPLYSAVDSRFNQDYAFEDPEGDDAAAFNVFTRRDGRIRHFWGEEMGLETVDPGQDARGAPDPQLLWSLLDRTPGGRGTDWYPTLEDGSRPEPAGRRDARARGSAATGH